MSIGNSLRSILSSQILKAYQMNNALHIPVLANEIVDIMNGYERIVVDATCGNGGHSYIIATTYTSAIKILFCFDKDTESLEIAKGRLSEFGFVKFIPESYTSIYQTLKSLDIRATFVLFDLGLSMWQIKGSGRGFTFKENEPLDMRFNPNEGLPLSQLLKKLLPQEIETILKTYGEVKQAGKIATQIVRERKRIDFNTTYELVSLLRHLGLSNNELQKVFMAFRIYVNKELHELVDGIKAALSATEQGGRIAFITYHSIEDRIIKRIAKIKGIYKVEPFPIYPSSEEIKANRAARSAKLRVFEKGVKDVKETDYAIIDSMVSSFPAPFAC